MHTTVMISTIKNHPHRSRTGFTCASLAMACVLLLTTACTGIQANSAAPETTQDLFGISTPTSEPTTTKQSLSPAQSTDYPLPLPKGSSPSPSATVPPQRSSQTTSQPTHFPSVVSPLPSGTHLPHPDQTSDLLFISEGKLKRWDYVTGFTGILVDNVAEFSVSASGKKLALLRPWKITANGVELFDLDLLDFESKQIITLLEKTSRPFKTTPSPDGGWIAYITSEGESKVRAIRSDASSPPIELGLCRRLTVAHCGDVAWSPDSRSILWSDSQGVWISYLEEASTQLVHSRKVEVDDPGGKKNEIQVDFNSLSWSPSGRYVLTEILPFDSGVSWHAVLDTRTGRLVEVPDSFEYHGPIASVSWLQDGNLLVAHAAEAPDHKIPFIKSWHILATHDELLVLDKKFDLHSDNFPSFNTQSEANSSHCLNWVAQQNTDSLHLGVTLPEAAAAPVLFALDLQKGKLEKLITIPHDTIEVLWSPDGGGVLIIASDGQLLFTPASGEALYDLLSVLGADASGFTWLPPAPRS